MSQSLLFIVGSIVFAVTIYGVVMAGGLVLTRNELEHNDRLAMPDPADLRAGLPVDVKY